MASLRDRFAADIDRLADLPSLSPVIAQLLSTLGRDDAGVAQIGDIIRQEPVLTAKVLHAANSAFYAGRAPATSIRDALLRLGLVTVRRLAMAMSLYSAVQVRGSRLSPGQFWLHSFGVAQAAEIIARHSATIPDNGDTEVVFLTGLLHDLGLLVLASHYPREYDAVAILAGRDNLGFSSAELTILETDHGELGGILVSHWGLPDDIAGPIGAHHRVEIAAPEYRWGACVIRLADLVCSGSGIGDLGETSALDADWKAAGIEPGAVEKILVEIRTEAQRATAALASAGS